MPRRHQTIDESLVVRIQLELEAPLILSPLIERSRPRDGTRHQGVREHPFDGELDRAHALALCAGRDLLRSQQRLATELRFEHALIPVPGPAICGRLFTELVLAREHTASERAVSCHPETEVAAG